VGAHDERKRLAMAEFIVAPEFEPAEDGMKALLRVFSSWRKMVM